MINEENKLELLEIGTRLCQLEKQVADLSMLVHLLIPVVSTLQEQTLYRVKEMNKKNGN